jgi:hypothetical protein
MMDVEGGASCGAAAPPILSVAMGRDVRRDDVFLVASVYFFTIGHAGSGGPNASSPAIVARIL